MEQNSFDIKEISNRIWKIGDICKGQMPAVDVFQVLLTLFFLRRVDCIIGRYASESKEFYLKNRDRFSDERMFAKLQELNGGYPFYNISGLNFAAIADSNESIGFILENYMQGFSDNILETLLDLQFDHYLAILNRNSMAMDLLLRSLLELDLSLNEVDNEEFTELYISLIEKISTRSNTIDSTPYQLSKLITECLFIEDNTHKDNKCSIYDPVCGTGGLLATACCKAKELFIHQDNIALYGQEVNLRESPFARFLAMLIGNEHSKICHGDTLTDDQFPDHRFDYILADMPIGLQWRPIKDRIERESIDANGRFYIGLPSISDSQFLFIEHIISKMYPQGSRAAFITTGSVLWGGSASSGESRIRRWLFENDMIETIMALPAGVMGYTNIPVYLWILSNKKEDKQKGHTRLIDLSIQEKKNVRVSISQGFVASAVALYKSYNSSSLSQIVKNEQFGFFEVDLLEDGKKKEKVSISLDTDIEEFIKKEIQPFAKGTITVDYSSVEKGYSVQFEKFFIAEETPAASLEDETQSLLSIIKNIVSLKANIEQIANKMKDKPDLNSWKELPLRSATDVLFGVNRPPVPNQDGLPILSVPYLRGASNEETLYDVSPKTKTASIKDVIIVVKGANTGEIFKGVDGILSPSLAAIKCTDENIIAPQYLYYLLKGNEKSLMSMAKGVTIKSLGAKSIPDFKCLIPPIKEQIRIASYLDKVVGEIDDVISALKGSGNAFVTYRQTLIENTIRGLWSVPEK